MIIHVVQEGETIQSIADSYGVPVDRVIIENELAALGILVPGQTIVITFPEKTYIVQNGDTLQGIAEKYGITVLDLLRNNPFLSDRKYIYPGESLVISYGKKIRKVTTNGYASDYIDRATLIKTLPYLTYLSILGYRITGNGDISEINDTDLLQLAKKYGVAPLLIITSLSSLGPENVENAYVILNNEDNMNKLIDNLIKIMKKKGYCGINISYELLTKATLSAYETFNAKAYARFKEEGLLYFLTITPHTVFLTDRITFEQLDYSRIVHQSDKAIILNYVWGSYLGPPAPISSIAKINEFLDFIIPQVLPEKLVVGMPLIAYDWELPYIVGITRAYSLSLDSAITLAKQVDTVILFDETSQSPFFTYSANISSIPVEHIVWFTDARNMDAVYNIITERGLNGGGLWNIMRYSAQLWLVINTQYEIEKLPHIIN
jgi:spore germination protein